MESNGQFAITEAMHATVADVQRQINELIIQRAGLVEVLRILDQQKATAVKQRDEVLIEVTQAIMDRDNARAELAAAQVQTTTLKT